MENTKDNVIQFPGKNAVFSPKLRIELEASIQSFTEKPSEAVTRIEQVICTYIVQSITTWVRKMATQAGESLGKKVVGNVGE